MTSSLKQVVTLSETFSIETPQSGLPRVTCEERAPEERGSRVTDEKGTFRVCSKMETWIKIKNGSS